MFQFLAAILVCYAVLTHKNVLAMKAGLPTTIDKHPYHIKVESNGTYVAGGALVLMTRVVTRADFLSKEGVYEAVAGSTSRCSSVDEVRKQVLSKELHSKYNQSTGDYNVALLHLESPFSWTPSIAVILLQPYGEEVLNNATAVATGFRARNKCGKLEYASVVKVSDEDVLGEVVFEGTITKRMHIFSNEHGRPQPLYDGGGPLVHNDKLVGLDINQGFKGNVIYTVYLKIADPEIRRFIYSNSEFDSP